MFVVFYFVDCSFGKCYFSVFFGEDIDYCDVIKLGCDFEYGYFIDFCGGNGYCSMIGFFDGDILSIFSEVMRKINLFWEMGLFVQFSGEYVLMSSLNFYFVSLINLGEFSKFVFEFRVVYWEREIIFFINGEIMYVVMWEIDIEGCKMGKVQVVVWECLSMIIKREK